MADKDEITVAYGAADSERLTEVSKKIYNFIKDELNLIPLDASQSLLFVAAMVAVLHMQNEEDFELELEVMARQLFRYGHNLYLLKDELLKSVH